MRLALLLALMPFAAFAENCGPHAAVAVILGERYGEHRHAVMMGADGTLVELWGRKGGTWTITRTTPDGIACVVAAGFAFEPGVDPLPDAGTDS